MRPSDILPQCLPSVFTSLHAATTGVLLKAVDALAQGAWLTLTEIARHWPDAERVAAPLKAADRLLRSRPLTDAREQLYGAMLVWLTREARPLVVVDWSDLKADGSFKLLRAGLAVRGRTLTMWEEVHPEQSAGSVKVESEFLRTLASLMPSGCRPIVLSDAGFRRPWFRAVVELGWDYVGRVRGTVQAQPETARPPRDEDWVLCSELHALKFNGRSRELGAFWLGRQHSLSTRLIVHHAAPKGRQAMTVKGKRRKDTASEDAARSAREPWVLATSLTQENMDTAKIAKLYARRMVIEQGFRDLKSGAFGAGFEHSLTHKGPRLANLLLLFALFQLAAWLIGLSEERRGEGGRLEHRNTHQRHQHSTLRLGMEVLKRSAWWPPPEVFYEFLREFANDCPLPLRTDALC